ncbi:unnamed protein product [Lampetra fluviatilis]
MHAARAINSPSLNTLRSTARQTRRRAAAAERREFAESASPASPAAHPHRARRLFGFRQTGILSRLTVIRVHAQRVYVLP